MASSDFFRLSSFTGTYKSLPRFLVAVPFLSPSSKLDSVESSLVLVLDDEVPGVVALAALSHNESSALELPL